MIQTGHIYYAIFDEGVLHWPNQLAINWLANWLERLLVIIVIAHNAWLYSGIWNWWAQPETALLVEADIKWVAHQIVENHDSEFLERVLWTATPCSGYSHPLCCQLNPWEMTDAVPYHDFLCSPHHEFCSVPYLLNSPKVWLRCSLARPIAWLPSSLVNWHVLAVC